LTEAIHTPFMQDRYLSIENAKYIFNNMKDFGNEITFKPNGIIEQRAQFVLQKARDLLKEIEKKGLFQALSEGIFAGIKRPIDGGRGLNGVIVKDPKYYNPFIDRMKDYLQLTNEEAN
ncbi:MAG TPA: D-lysine 5,6-aminomutase subunit alpha, partial [Candidatus Cloacimonetes bacterium]|nr:D-lysine 5,6-aminomutase subunit alpha [Candidatus Cloacimonadota bacterium]